MSLFEKNNYFIHPDFYSLDEVFKTLTVYEKHLRVNIDKFDSSGIAIRLEPANPAQDGQVYTKIKSEFLNYILGASIQKSS